MLGSPIRKSSDQSSVDSSPRLIAASYVLHRLLVPRHPPCALINLPQRCSRPLCSSQGTGSDPSTTPAHPTTKRRGRTRKTDAEPRSTNKRPRRPGNQHPFPQDPTVCLHIPTNHQPPSTRPQNPEYQQPTPATTRTSQRSTLEQPPRNTRPCRGMLDTTLTDDA